MSNATVTCSWRFKSWWQRCARHYASALMEDEGRRYGLLWYAYRHGWRHGRKALQDSLESPGLPTAEPGSVAVETRDEPAP